MQIMVGMLCKLGQPVWICHMRCLCIFGLISDASVIGATNQLHIAGCCAALVIKP